MSGLNNLKNRLRYRGSDVQGRIVQRKAESFDRSLDLSYSAAVAVMEDGREFRCLINPNKVTMDEDDKMLSIHYNDINLLTAMKEDTNIKVGSVIEWKENGTRWTVYLQQLQERAYFRGLMRKCDAEPLDLGDGIKRWVCLKGPTQKTINWKKAENFSFNDLNYTMELIIAKDAFVENYFHRFKKVTYKGQPWEVQATDEISNEGFISVYLKEDYINTFANANDAVQESVFRYIRYTISESVKRDRENAFYQIFGDNGEVIESGYQHSTVPKNTYYVIALINELPLKSSKITLKTWDSGNKEWAAADKSVFTNDMRKIERAFQQAGMETPSAPYGYTLWADLSSEDYGTDYRFIINEDASNPNSIINKIITEEIPLYQITETPIEIPVFPTYPGEIIPQIMGDKEVYPYDIKDYIITGVTGGHWELSNDKAIIVSQTDTIVKIEITTGKSGEVNLVYITDDEKAIAQKITILSL